MEIKAWLTDIRSKNINLIEQIINTSMSHQIMTKNIINIDSFIMTKDHINILLNKQLNWTYSFDPYLNLPQFLSYISQVS